MPQCCYLAKGAKRPSHTTNMPTSSPSNIPSSTNVFCSKMGILQRSVFGYVSGWGERRQRSLQRHQQSCRYFKKVSRTTEVSKKLLYVWLYYKSEVLYTIVLIENFFRIRKNTLYFVSMSTEVHVLR